MIRARPFLAPIRGLLGLFAVIVSGCTWDHVLGYGPDDPGPDAGEHVVRDVAAPGIEAADAANSRDAAGSDVSDVSSDAKLEASLADGTNDVSFADGADDAITDSHPTDAAGDVSTDTSLDGESGAVDASSTDAGSADAEAESDAARGIVVPLVGRICSADGWCWTNPLPQGNDFNGVWGAAADDVWAVGAEGTLLHYDGSQWSGTAIEEPYIIKPVIDGTETYWGALTAVAGSSASDVWAVGGHTDGTGQILHFDGTSWSENPDGAKAGVWNALWVGGPNEAWAVGEALGPSRRGIFLHWNGTSWSELDGTNLFTDNMFPAGVWSSGPNDVWVISAVLSGPALTGHVSHFDGATWTDVGEADLATVLSYTAVWGSSPTDVWIGATGGSDTELEHWDGSTWKRIILSNTGSNFVSAITGQGPDDIWLCNTYYGGASYGIWHYDGQSWQLSPGTEPANALWRRNTDDIWALGRYGNLEHFDGSTWSNYDALASGFNGVWGSSENDVWAAGSVRVNSRASYNAAIVHWDGQAWSVAMSSAAVGRFGGIWGSGTDVWAVGSSGTIVHGSAGTFSTSNPTSTDLVAVGGTSASDVWAVGSGGTILHSDDGTSWNPSSSGSTANLTSVWAIAEGDAWAVGAGGTVLHWVASAWNTVTTGSTEDLNAVWASGPNDVWGVGHAGTILHWDGLVWTTVNLTPGYLTSVWGTGPNDVWITGDLTYHWDGKSWTRSDTGTAYSTRFYGGWGNAHAVFVVGVNAALEKVLDTSDGG